MKYLIVSSWYSETVDGYGFMEAIKSLEGEVCGYLNNGWELQGGISFSQNRIAQALIKNGV